MELLIKFFGIIGVIITGLVMLGFQYNWYHLRRYSKKTDAKRQEQSKRKGFSLSQGIFYTEDFTPLTRVRNMYYTITKSWESNDFIFSLLCTLEK